MSADKSVLEPVLESVFDLKKVGTKEMDYEVTRYISAIMGHRLKMGIPTGSYEHVPPGRYAALYLLNDVAMLILYLDSGEFDTKYTYVVSLRDLMSEVRNLKVSIKPC